MKLVALSFAVLAVASVMCCNPDGNNKPNCTLQKDFNRKIHNFWDPTHFWFCETNGAEPVSKLCADELEGSLGGNGPAFNASTATCVEWNEWVWVAPCSL